VPNRHRPNRAKHTKWLLILGAILLIGVLAVVLGLPHTKKQPPAPTITPTPEGWKLAWADEFDAPDGSAPDSAKWNFSTGGGGWGNAEMQYYTDRIENAYIEDGSLVIEAREEEGFGFPYTSVRINTLGKGDWTYGRFEVRAKLPYGQGIWPAIWMLPSNYTYGGWPASGEIDIMELIGHEPGRVYGTLHYGMPRTQSGDHYDLPEEKRFADDYHVFALEWEAGEMRWYVDDDLYQAQTEWFTSSTSGKYPAPFDHNFHIIMNIAVGGRWPGYPDETTEFPQTMRVDYVRVYQR
jgi:beta-glucanase (GH16 family)